MELNDKQKQFFGAMEGTFESPGWSLIRQGWIDEQKSLPESLFHNAKSMDDVYTSRVRYGLLAELIRLPQTVAEQREAIENIDPDDDFNV